ncbi:uncharacterized protein UV8b_06622 [Ustilaginoidea virens]|uniref:Uncharacterized protein n=1 Tax=Ustilaginoidea virens TaxID=1159556 RepID=A0A063C632_USTVR|nr:uncharacterized protein UV8b_06622 [Ustilaginoidea virens]QUC22381.1 hypothetical protein UV8b_06622 [Ustilaginoidea virens]GAO18512.1 hypothetical protein UVI_02054540 [Ustilaginoidea virens]
MEEFEAVRRDGESGGLGLGGLLGIALGGGILLFTTVGMLMAWRIKARQNKSPGRAYAIPDEFSQTRLTKRSLLMTESAVSGFSSRFSSRLSLTLPPIIPLPPMPSYSSFSFFFRTPSRKEKAGRRSWVGGDDFPGPPVNHKNARGGVFSRDGWLGHVPTVPSMTSIADQEDHIYDKVSESTHVRKNHAQRPYYEEYRKQQQKQQQKQPEKCHVQNQQRFHAQTDRVVSNFQNSKTAPNLGSPGDFPRGRPSIICVPAQAHIRPSITMTDLDLRNILRSTDERLREGHSRSPTKQPAQPPSTSGSPVKTPRARYSSSIRKVERRHGKQTPSTPSPAKGEPMSTSPRKASVASISSAATSLIAEATHQLELLGGMCSPSRPRAREWEPREKQILSPSAPGLASPLFTPSHSPKRSPQTSPRRNAQQGSPQRPRSRDSDRSSSLSTLYSVGEPESEKADAQGRQRVGKGRHSRQELEQQILSAAGDQDDPFVENRRGTASMGGETLSGQPRRPRPLRVIKSMSPSHFVTAGNESLIPRPLRPKSAMAKGVAGRGFDAGLGPPGPLVLQPLGARHSLEMPPKREQHVERGQTPQAASRSSFTSAYIPSQEPEAKAMLAREVRDPVWQRESNAGRTCAAGSPPPIPTRHGDRRSAMSASRSSRKDVPSMILANDAQRRAPSHRPQATASAPDGPVIPAKLSPRRSVHRSSGGRSSRRGSSGSSPGCSSSTGVPVRRVTSSPSGDAPALGTTIAELRRMNSVVSSNSATSIASSTVLETRTDAATRTRSTFNDKTVSPRQVPRPPPAAIGMKHYLNIGNANAEIDRHKSMISLPRTVPSPSSSSPSKRPQSAGPLKAGSPAAKERGKENYSSGVRQGRQEELPRLREVPQSPVRSPREVFKPKFTIVARSPPPRGGSRALKHGAVANLLGHEQRGDAGCRDSAGSLGLYDKDGFLLPSPERETRKRSPRM